MPALHTAALLDMPVAPVAVGQIAQQAFLPLGIVQCRLFVLYVGNDHLLAIHCASQARVLVNLISASGNRFGMKSRNTISTACCAACSVPPGVCLVPSGLGGLSPHTS